MAGVITNLTDSSKTIEIIQGKNTIRMDNPLPYLKKRSEQLSEYLNNNHYWYKVKKLFEIAGVGKIPVYSVLCFGPTAKIEKQKVNYSLFSKQ
jgi:hypothetical protein